MAKARSTNLNIGTPTELTIVPVCIAKLHLIRNYIIYFRIKTENGLDNDQQLSILGALKRNKLRSINCFRNIFAILSKDLSNVLHNFQI
jgi:hypothetical protein